MITDTDILGAASSSLTTCTPNLASEDGRSKALFRRAGEAIGWPLSDDRPAADFAVASARRDASKSSVATVT